MGKLKKNSRSSRIRRQQQKLGKNDSTDGTSSSSSSTGGGPKHNKVLPLIQKLSSTVPNDRSMAISAISVLCDDPNVRKQLLKEKLVNIILEQCLTDNNDEIVVQSYGLLRNLVLEEGYDLSKFLIRSKIMVSIEASVLKAWKSFEFMASSEPTDNNKTISIESKRELYDFAENLIGLTTGLLISDEDIFQELMSNNSIGFMYEFLTKVIDWSISLSSNKISSSLANSILDFVYQLANQSSDFVMNLSTNLPLEKFIAFKTHYPENNLSKVYMEALTFHFTEVLGTTINTEQFVLQSLESVVNTISTVNIANALEIINKSNETPNVDQKIDIKAENKAIFDARNDLESIDIALDLIATLIELHGSTSSSSSSSSLQDGGKYYIQVITPALLQLLSYKDQSFLNKSLICLNNLCWLFFDLQTKPVEWFETVGKIWDMTFIDFIQLQDSNNQNQNQTQDSDVVETMCDYLKLLIVLARSLDVVLLEQHKISLEQIDKILHKSNTINELVGEDVDLLKVYYIDLIGFITVIARMPGTTTTGDSNAIQITSHIGGYLIETIQSCLKILNEPIQGTSNNNNGGQVQFLRKNYFYHILAMECTSGIFEIFGDEQYTYDGPIFIDQGYLQKLIDIAKSFKPVHKEIDKNKEKDLKLKAQQVSQTLDQFIDYKKKNTL